jgi:PKD repeat protein
MKKIILSLLMFTLFFVTSFGQSITPQLQSRPNANVVFLVDFDGATVTNQWAAQFNAGKPIIIAPSNLNAAQRLEVYQIVANSFAIFDINVTTIKSIYDTYAWNKKSRLMSTPTNFAGAGGIAWISALNVGSPVYEYCFAFEGSLQANPKFIAQAGTHELGHTANLGHQGMYNTSGTKTADYHFGKGTGELSWGPIMGAPYNANVCQWVIGPSALPTTPTFTYTVGTFAGTTIVSHQNDWLYFILKKLNGVEGGEYSTAGHPTSGIKLLADDIGNTITNAKTMNVVNGVAADSGLINIAITPANATTYITGTRPTDPKVVLDEDVFKITVSQTSNLNIKCRPWSQDILTNKNGMLDTRIVLRNASGGIIAVDSNLARLNSEINLSNVAQGDYFITVGASSNSQLTDNGYGYGVNQNTRFQSVGRYYLNVTISGSSSIPTANFIAPTRVCVGASTQLSNTSVGGTSFTWNFGSGASPATSTAINPSVVWNTAGTKTITLTATNSSGSNTTTKTLTVVNPPTPNILATYNGISCPEGSSCPTTCVGTPITLTAQPTGDNAAPYTYYWIGQGEALYTTTQSVTVTNPQIVSGSTGAGFNCIMTNSAGCSAEGYKWIPLTQRPNATISGPTTISAGQTITLSVTAVSGNTYSWSTGATTSSINITLAGTYRVTVSKGGCSSTGSLVVNSSGCTVTPSISGVSSLCTNQSGTLTASATGSSPFTYKWSTGSTAQTITINSAGSYTVTVTGNGGCTATTTRNVTANPNPTITISGTNSICQGGFTTLTASGGNSYTWSTGNVTASITVSPTITTTYTVTGVNSNGCSGIASRIVTVFPNTPATIDGVNSVCDGSSALFTASNGASYSWNTGSTTASITVNQGNTYTVVVTSANGCTSSASKTLTIDLLPNVTSSSNSPLCPGETLNLQSSPSGLVSYTWTGPNGFSATTQNATLTNVQPINSGLYLVTGVDSKGCSSTISTAVVINNAVSNLSVTSNSPVCINSTLQIVASGGSSYSWTGPNGYTGIGSTVSINNVNEANGGTYVVTSTSACGSVKDSIQIIIDAPIVAKYNVTACKPSETSNFTVSGVNTFSFSPTTNVDPSSGTITGDIEAIQSLFTLSTTPRTYILTTTSTSGCTKVDTFYTQRIVPPSMGSVLGLNSTGATLSWNNTGGEEYQVRYRRKGATNWVLLQPIKVDNVQITNLTPNTNYEWQVRSKCNCESWSAFSKLFNFSTP